MEDQTQTTQSIQDQTDPSVDSTETQTDTTVAQPEISSVDQTTTASTPAESTNVPIEESKKLTGADVLASYGLVEIYDARLGAFCQVKKEDAQKMLESLDSLRTALGV